MGPPQGIIFGLTKRKHPVYINKGSKLIEIGLLTAVFVFLSINYTVQNFICSPAYFNLQKARKDSKIYSSSPKRKQWAKKKSFQLAISWLWKFRCCFFFALPKIAAGHEIFRHIYLLLSNWKKQSRKEKKTLSKARKQKKS